MAKPDRTTIGIFVNGHEAATALERVHTIGVSRDSLSVIMRDEEKAKDLAAETGATVGKSTTAGVGAGAAVGALAGLVIGISAFVVPGVGPLLIAGPLAASLGITGAATATGAVTGAAAGGILGALTGLGVSAAEAEKYEEAVRKGDILVAVATKDTNYLAVERTLEHAHARDVKTVGKDLADVHATRYRGETPA